MSTVVSCLSACFSSLTSFFSASCLPSSGGGGRAGAEFSSKNLGRLVLKLSSCQSEVSAWVVDNKNPSIRGLSVIYDIFLTLKREQTGVKHVDLYLEAIKVNDFLRKHCVIDKTLLGFSKIKEICLFG